MKKFLIAILAFLYFTTPVDRPATEHFRLAERSGNARKAATKKGSDVMQTHAKGDNKQNVHLQNSGL